MVSVSVWPADPLGEYTSTKYDPQKGNLDHHVFPIILDYLDFQTVKCQHAPSTSTTRLAHLESLGDLLGHLFA